MIALNHALTGATVAVAINRPIIALPAALLSHFAIDMLPHWNYKVPGHASMKRLVIGMDMLLSTIFFGVLVWSVASKPWLAFLGGLLAVLPDTMWLPYILHNKPSLSSGKGWLARLRRFHMRIQWSETDFGFWLEMLWLVLILTVFVHVAS